MATRAARRQRLGLILALLLGVVLLAVAIAAGAGSAAAPPATGAAAVVPADALAYVHVSVDPSRPSVKRALALARRFPDFSALSASVLNRLAAIAGGSATVDFSRDIRPWLGKEAALALLDTSTATADTLIVLDVSNHGRAQAFLTRSGAVAAGSYRGVQLRRYSSGVESAFVGGHYLALGHDTSVRAAIDVASGGSPGLAADPAYRRAAAGEPADRVLDAYASASGVRRALVGRGGVAGALGALLDRPALAGITVSVSAAASGVRLRVHTALDPSLARLSGAARATSFAPTLQKVMPSGATLLLDVSRLDRLAPHVLAASADIGIAGQIGPLLKRLGSALAAEGVNVQRILSIFQGESAVAVVPGAPASGSGGTEGAGPPALVIVGRTRDQASTRGTLASLEFPLAQLFAAPSSGPGQAPEFNDRLLDGVTVHQLSLAAGLQLDYAVFGGLVVVSTSIDGVAAVVHHSRSLSQEPAFEATLGSHPQRITSLLFLDFSQLLSLGEQMGLTRGARFSALAPDLQMIRTVGLHSTSGEADTTAELFLQIS